MRAYYLIGEKRDSVFIPALIENLGDAKVSHDYRSKGMSLYQPKVNALVKITGLNPPNQMNYKPDSVNRRYFFIWAR